MKKKKTLSYMHEIYVKKLKRENAAIQIFRVALLLAILALWELFASIGVIDAFISSSPSRIAITIKDLFANDNLLYHIAVTLYETLLGFLIAVGLGYAIALALWWSERARRILEPYIVVLNSLPKIALGPIIIVWFGSGSKAIIFMAVLIGVIVAIITMLNGFLATDKDKILLLRSMGATKFQILGKLVIPGSMPTFISMLKISVGMAWIGSIMGEYLVSRAGLGYLIVYGGQVFKLDLVMAATVVLCLLAAIMYSAVALLEKKIVKYKDR
ncbi:MAG TPA: sulfonate ABC transporter permease [Clostridiales bacterium]|nr:sulfonate ABC transporter permease [Clostridiales bacterium]